MPTSNPAQGIGCGKTTRQYFRRIGNLGSSRHLLSRWFLAWFYGSTLQMEAVCLSETLVDFQRTTRRCILEVRDRLALFFVLWSFKYTSLKLIKLEIVKK
jgi:hypothetical protein